MIKVGEHITLDIIGTTREYDPSVFEKVIKKISQWQKRYENNSKLMRIHAEILIKDQRWEEAKECIERAIEIEPNDRNYFVLGEILFHFGKIDSACETYRKSIRAKSREDD